MSHRIHRHITRNLIGYVALFCSLTLGTAQALNGSNTVFTDDIVNGHVRSADVGTGQVRAADLADDTTPYALTGLDIKNESMGGHDIINGDVTGLDIDEASLGTVPMAAQGGTGRYAFAGACDPESTAYENCAFVPLPVAKPGRALIMGQVEASPDGDAEWGMGNCRLEVDGVPIQASETLLFWDEEDVEGGRQNATLTAVTDVLPPGNPVIGIECRERQTPGGDGTLHVHLARVTAVALSAN